MRSFGLILLLTLTTTFLNAQDNTETGDNQEQKLPTAGQILTNHYAYTYQAALRYNDYTVAKAALYSLLVENPQNDSILYSLSALYYQLQQYPSAALTANDLLAKNPDNLGALEISANALEKLGARDKALESYESLYLKTEDFQTLYKIAFLQYDLGRFAESLTNVDILMGKKEAEELKAVFNTTSGEQKEYPIKVSLLNLKGLISKEQGNKEKAREFFNEALKLAPEFELAKENLAALNK